MSIILRTDSGRALPPIAQLTVEQYHEMLEKGILKDGDPIELLDGMLVYKDRSDQGDPPMTIGHRHSTAVALLTLLQGRLDGQACHVRTQAPITLPPHHEPEPDGVIVGGQPRDYPSRHPHAGDVSCVIEVSDSSLEYDRTEKRAKYAAAGIAQYLIVNLAQACVECFEVPDQQGNYSRHSTLKDTDEIQLLLPSGKRIAVQARELLP